MTVSDRDVYWGSRPAVKSLHIIPKMRAHGRRTVKRGSQTHPTTAGAIIKKEEIVPIQNYASNECQCHEALPRSKAALHIEGLPGEVLQVIGSHLGPLDLINARSTCRFWAQHIAQGVDRVCVQLHPDPLMARQKLEHIKTLTPTARQMSITVTGRVPQATFDDYIRQLRPFNHLKTVDLIFHAPQDPKYTMASPSFRSYEMLATLPNLAAINIKDGPAPRQDDYAALAACTQLTKLTVSNMASKATNFLASSAHAEYVVQQAQLPDLALLSSLRHLEVPLARDTSNDISPLAALSQLTALTVSNMGPVGDAAQLSFLSHLTSLKHLELDIMAGPQLSELGLHKIKGLAALGLTLTVRSNLSEDLAYLTTTTSPVLEKLVLRGCQLMSSSQVQQVASLSGLRHFEILGPGLESFNMDISCINLRPLSQLTRLTTLVYNKRHSESVAPHGLMLCSTLNKMVSAWGGQLVSLELDSVPSSDLTPTALQSVSKLTGLKRLVLKGSDNTPALLQVSMQALPPTLESLDLRYVHLGCPLRHTRMPTLRHLGMAHCSLGCSAHFQEAVSGLCGLSSLEWEDMRGVDANHVAALSSLTSLTSLSIIAVSNQHITNAALAPLTTLSDLRYLKWHAGDMLDSTLDPSVLKAFNNLYVLSITTSMYYRMTRWSALSVMDFLPYCQLEAL